MSEHYVEDCQETVSPEVFDKISEEIRDASSKETMQCKISYLCFISVSVNMYDEHKIFTFICYR